MTRRPNTRIDPAVDLSKHYFAVESLSGPLSLETWFGRTAPVELEIGSGKGLFLENQTGAHPERLYIGNELAFGYAKLVAPVPLRVVAPWSRIARQLRLYLVRPVQESSVSVVCVLRVCHALWECRRAVCVERGEGEDGGGGWR